MTGRKLFVSLQTFPGKRKGIFPDNRRNRYLNPFLPRPFTGTTAAGRKTAALTQKACDLFPLRMLRFTKTRRSLVGRVTEHGPHGRPVPRRFSSAGLNAESVKPPIDLPYTQRL